MPRFENFAQSIAMIALWTTFAQAQVSYTGQAYGENFDILAGVSNNTLNVPWADNATVPGWYATKTSYHVTNGTIGGTPATFNSTATTVNNVGLFSFGAAGSPDRSLGSRATASFVGNDPIRYGVRLINNSGATQTRFSILLTGEQWFQSSAATAHSLNVDYQIGALGLNAAGWTSLPALAFASPGNAATAATLDGNAAANRAAKVTTVSGINWQPGQHLWIRISDANDSGEEQGLAMDDFVFWTGEDAAIYFNGASSYVTMGAATSTLGLSVLTVECWFLRAGAGATTSTGSGGVTAVPLVTKGRAQSDGTNVDCNYFLGVDTSGRLVADFEAAPAPGITAGQNYPVTGVATVPMNVWNHAAVTYDGSTWRLYLNGVLDATVTLPPGASPRADSLQHFGIGTAMNSTGVAAGYFQGVIDEVRVWNVARSAAEIQANMNLRMTSPVTGLRGRYGLSEGTGMTTSGLVGPVGTLVGSPQWVQGPALTPNPNQPPVINAISPADNASGIGSSTTLSVSVDDPNSDAMTVTFYGTATAPATPGPDFVIGTLPDTQHYSENIDGTRAAIFYGQTQWYVDNRDALNLAFVSHMGDIVQDGDFGGNHSQWIVADTAIKKIENPLTTLRTHGIPFGAAPGNKDQTPTGSAIGSTTLYNQYFGVNRYTGRSYWGGNFGTNNDNNYQLFSASGLDFVIIHLEYDNRTPSNYQDVLGWADAVLKAYPERRAIVTSHWIVNTGNPASFSTQGRAIYDSLKDNPNLFLMLCGHVSGEGRRSDVFEGRTVHSILQDYQSRANGGDGWLRYFIFSPANNTITAKTYSPKLGLYETDANSQFVLPYDMQATVTGWVPLGTVNVTSGGTVASLDWTGLDPGSYYAWYASVTDGVYHSDTVPRSFSTTGVSNTVSLQNGTNGYSGMVDSHIRGDATTTNYGGSTELRVDGDPDQSSLLRWDLSSIPAGATITNATLTFNVTNVTQHVYELYALKRAWSESTTTWGKADAAVNWQSAGAKGANDRDTIVLGSLNSSATGPKTIALNSSGIAKVQSWVNSPSTNFGFILQDYTVSDSIILSSSEAAAVSQRPVITITYE